MKLSPAEQDEFYKKYQDEKRSLLRTAQPTKQQPYADRLQQALQSVPEEHRNQPWQLNKDGELSLPTGYKMSDPVAEQAKQAEKFQKDNDKYTEQIKTEAQRLADANVPMYTASLARSISGRFGWPISQRTVIVFPFHTFPFRRTASFTFRPESRWNCMNGSLAQRVPW